MKLGFNLLLWTTHVTDEHSYLFDRLKAVGYDGVEIPVFEGSPAEYAPIAKRLKSAGLEATAAMAMRSGCSAISSDPQLRAGALDHLKWATNCATEMSASILCGPFYQPLGEFSGKGPTSSERTYCAEVHKQAAQHAAKSGVSLSVEPLNRFECYFLNTTADARALVTLVDEPNYGYLYDTFHANIEEKSQPEAIRMGGGAINHVHISENDRGAPGSGQVNFPQVFATLKQSGYDGWMTVESFGQALPDLAAATRVWRPLFVKPEDVYEAGFRTMRAGWDAAPGRA